MLRGPLARTPLDRTWPAPLDVEAVERLGWVRQGGDDEAGVIAPSHDLSLLDHAAGPGPGVGPIAELAEQLHLLPGGLVTQAFG